MRSQSLVYSTYEAKARFSEILRRVRDGASVIVTYRGEEVAVIRPIDDDDLSLEQRVAQLQARGVLDRARTPSGDLRPVASREGALARFLESRN
ncbi:MAG: hypothetical protein CME06_06655 [Gemmatimonadetes bacterium]|nr:hypothetical protein [Gemmatimonadota bacterium]